VIEIMNLERVVRMESMHAVSEEKNAKSGKMEGSGATTIKKMETNDHEELATGKEIVQDGMLSRARTVWRVKAMGTTGWQVAAMDRAVPGLNNLGFEVISLTTPSRRLRGMNGDAIAVLLEATTGIKTGMQRPNKIPSGWTPQKWKSRTKSTHKKISRNGRSA
jgi:hypothetical protein